MAADAGRHRTTPSSGAFFAVAAIVALVIVGGCSNPVRGGAAGSSGSGRQVRVVTSTNVYADVARATAGPDAGVTSIITDEHTDPHSYVGNARDVLALKRADVVIVNGGGYDRFMDPLVDAAHVPTSRVIDAVALAGGRDDVNEHVFFDPVVMTRVVDALVARLARVDPARARGYRARATAQRRDLADLGARCRRIDDEAGGAPVLVTDPAPLVLVTRCGLVDRTPPQFSDAIEEGIDVAPRLFAEVLGLVTRGEVRVVVTNPASVDSQVDRVAAAARQAKIPEVDIGEILPSGVDYVQWMRGNLAALAAAVGGKR